jgi:predicted nucleic acid-binding protein
MQLFIDTNVLLSFYAFNQEDLEEISKLADLVAAGEVTLLITDQVLDEFYRNRERRIEGALKSFYGQIFNPQLPQICQDYPEIVQLRETLQAYEKAHSAMVAKISIDIKAKNLPADRLLQCLFTKGTKLTIDTAVIDRARLRMSVGNPPGKNNSLGDAINWECLLAAVPDGTDLFLISGDKDYSSVFSEDDLSDFLRDEWERRKQSTIHFYRRLSGFCQAQLPTIGIANLRDRDFLVRELASSQSLADVQKYISKLCSYPEFTAAQVNGMVVALFHNQRVAWAIADDEIRSFWLDLISRYDQYLDPATLDRLRLMLTPSTPDQARDEPLCAPDSEQ